MWRRFLQRRVQLKMLDRAVEPFLCTYHVRDAHQDIVHNVCEVICGIPVKA